MRELHGLCLDISSTVLEGAAPQPNPPSFANLTTVDAGSGKWQVNGDVTANTDMGSLELHVLARNPSTGFFEAMFAASRGPDLLAAQSWSFTTLSGEQGPFADLTAFSSWYYLPAD